MTPLVLTGIVLSGLLAGAFVGAVGIGGVLLAPLLLAFTPFDLKVIMAAASFSFLFTGLVGSVDYARRGSVPWRQVLWVGVGVIPAALLGARVNALLPAPVLALILAMLLAAAGLNALRPARRKSGAPASLPAAVLLSLGVIVGFGSALTGTGGPVLLVPLLLLLGSAPLNAVGTAQVIQVPLAVFATAGYALYGELNLTLGLLLGFSQAAAVLLGARLAHALPATRLRRVVALALLLAACVLGGRALVPPTTQVSIPYTLGEAR